MNVTKMSVCDALTGKLLLPLISVLCTYVSKGFDVGSEELVGSVRLKNIQCAAACFHGSLLPSHTTAC